MVLYKLSKYRLQYDNGTIDSRIKKFPGCDFVNPSIGSYNATAESHLITRIWRAIYFGVREPRAFRSSDSAITADDPRRGPVQFHNSERGGQEEKTKESSKSSSLRYLCRERGATYKWQCLKYEARTTFVSAFLPRWRSFRGDIEEIRILYQRETRWANSLRVCQSRFLLRFRVLAVCADSGDSVISQPLSSVIFMRKDFTTAVEYFLIERRHGKKKRIEEAFRDLNSEFF